MNYPVAVNHKLVKRTRNRHRCCECGATIPHHTACMVAAGIWNDGPGRHYWCLLCEMIRNNFLPMMSRDLHETMCFGELLDYVREVPCESI